MRIIKRKKRKEWKFNYLRKFKLNELVDISYEERNILFNDTFKDLIGHKNIQFLLDEY